MSAQDHDHDDRLPEKDAALLTQALAPRQPEADRAALMKAKILGAVAAGRQAGASPEQAGVGSGAGDITSMVAPVATAYSANLDAHSALSALTVRVHERDWREVARGVEMCMLHEDGQSRSILLRMQPGSFLPPHRHTMSEESILLEGDAIIGEDLNLRAGDFHFSPAGALHPLLQSPGGCIVYVRGEKGFHPRVTMGLFKRMLRSLSARTDR